MFTSLSGVLGGLTDKGRMVAATTGALESAGFRDVGGALGERPFTYCAGCRHYAHFNYWSRNGVIVTACKDCGVVPVDERAKTLETR